MRRLRLVKISFVKNKPTIEVATGSNLMTALLEAGVPVASSCNGDGVCAKCKIKIIEGLENLSPENETEKFLKNKESFDKSVRISCQTKVLGNITIDTNYW